MLLIGLTGSIGMGKSETARMFEALGVPVYDADRAIHLLYDRGGAAVKPVSEAFPGSVKDDAVDRAALSALLLENPQAFEKLEAIVHPLAGIAQRRFLNDAKSKGHDVAVLDIPLLYEKDGDGRVDVVVVVSAPHDVQRARVMARSGMSAEKFEAILARQVPDEEKRRRADFIVDTSKGLDDAKKQVAEIIQALKGRKASAFDRMMKSDSKSTQKKNA